MNEIQTEAKRLIEKYQTMNSAIFDIRAADEDADHLLGLLRADRMISPGAWAHVEWQGLFEFGKIVINWCLPNPLKPMVEWKDNWVEISPDLEVVGFC